MLAWPPVLGEGAAAAGEAAICEDSNKAKVLVDIAAVGVRDMDVSDNGSVALEEGKTPRTGVLASTEIGHCPRNSAHLCS